MTDTLRIAVRKFAPFEQALEKQFADFVAQTGVDVRLETTSMDLNPLHATLFDERALADGRFDLAFLATDWIAEAHAAGLLEDLTPFMARDPIADFPQGWSPSLLQLQSFAGGFWGMPYHDGPECLIYRKDLLAAAGIEVPATWDAFHEAARRLHDPANGVYGTTLALYPDGHNTFYDFCIHTWTRGGEPFDAQGRPDFLTAPAIAALDFIRTLARDTTAIAPDARELDSVRSGMLFCEGKVALMANWFGFAALGETWADSRVRGLVDVAPLPAGDGGRSVSLNVFWVIALAAGSHHKDTAWAFVRHLASAPMDRITTLEGAIGTRRSTWDDAEVNRIVPYYHRLAWLHEHAREMPTHPRLADIAHVVDETIAAAIIGDAPSEQLLHAAQRRIEEFLA
jgi:multiple sugar transport system substrate-binding protein